MTHVPDMHIASGAPAFASHPGSGVSLSSAADTHPLFTAIAPPPQTQNDRSGRRQRVFGLVPAAAGTNHPIITKEAPRVRINPADVSKTRADLRRAQANARAMESALTATVTASSPGGDNGALLKARDANDTVAALTRKLADMEANNAARPIRVSLCGVREPSEVADALSSGETAYVCMHEGCRGQAWPDESALRRAHPTHTDMARAMQTHVYALVSEAPIDPLDPEGERIGYIAPVGRDGTKVERLAAAAVEADEIETARDAEVASLRAQLAALAATVEKLTGAKK